MPDEGTETTEGLEENTGTGADPALADRLDQIEARLAAGSRDSVIAGVVPVDVLATPLGQFFATNYQGEITADGVRTEAVRLGLVPAPSETTASAEEQEAHNRALDLRHGGLPVSGEIGPHPDEIAREAAKAARKSGTEDEALGAYIESHARSVVAGDSRRQINVFAGAGAVRGR